MKERKNGPLIVDGVDLSDFVGIPYIASRHPGNVSVDEFLLDPSRGSNCQLLALGVLQKAGFHIPSDLKMDQGERFGSKELWQDKDYTEKVFESDSNGGLRGISHYLCENSKPFDVFFLRPSVMRQKEISGSVMREKGLFAEDDLKLHVAISIGRREELSRRLVVLHNAFPGPARLDSLGSLIGKPRLHYLMRGIKRCKNYPLR